MSIDARSEIWTYHRNPPQLAQQLVPDSAVANHQDTLGRERSTVYREVSRGTLSSSLNPLKLGPGVLGKFDLSVVHLTTDAMPSIASRSWLEERGAANFVTRRAHAEDLGEEWSVRIFLLYRFATCSLSPSVGRN